MSSIPCVLDGLTIPWIKQLNSRSFFRHDLAHLAVEMEVPLKLGFWGSVTAGASLSGKDLHGEEIVIAESLAGPVQTLMRIEASIKQYSATLRKIRPDLASEDLARRIRERGRRLPPLSIRRLI